MGTRAGRISLDFLARLLWLAICWSIGLLVFVSQSSATQYYACFSGGTGACSENAVCTALLSTECSDACPGTLQVGANGANGPWCHLPGTRDAANTTTLNTHTLVSNDRVSVKGSTKQTSASGGVVNIDSTLYGNGTQANPIFLSVATCWNGSCGLGPYFTIDASGVTGVSFSGVVTISNRTGITVDGLEVLNSASNADAQIKIKGNTTRFVTVKNSRFFNTTDTGIYIDTSGGATQPGFFLIDNNIVDTFPTGGIALWQHVEGYVTISNNTVTNKYGVCHTCATGTGGSGVTCTVASPCGGGECCISSNARDPIQVGGGSTTSTSRYVWVNNNTVHDSTNDGIDAGGHACHDHYLIENNNQYDSGDIKVHGNGDKQGGVVECATEDPTYNIVRFNRITNSGFTIYTLPADQVIYHNTWYPKLKTALFFFDACAYHQDTNPCPRATPLNMGNANFGTGPGSGDRDFGRLNFKNNLYMGIQNLMPNIGWNTGGCLDFRNSSVKLAGNMVGGNNTSNWFNWATGSTCSTPLTSFPMTSGGFTSWQNAFASNPNDPGGAFTSQTDAQMFVSAATRDYHLVTGANALGAGVALTHAVGAGAASTSLTVERASYFHDDWDPARRCTANGVPWACCTALGVGASCGGPMLTPDSIVIGAGAAVAITAVNDSTNVITLAAARTWSNNDNVNLSTLSNPPDVGAFQGAVTTTTSTSTTTSTVFPGGTCRGCKMSSHRIQD